MGSYMYVFGGPEISNTFEKMSFKSFVKVISSLLPVA